jgi:Na+/phosphate symporter
MEETSTKEPAKIHQKEEEDEQVKRSLELLKMQLASYQGFLDRNPLSESQRKHAQSLINIAQELQDFNPQMMNLTCLYELCISMFVDHLRFLHQSESLF